MWLPSSYRMELPHEAVVAVKAVTLAHTKQGGKSHDLREATSHILTVEGNQGFQSPANAGLFDKAQLFKLAPAPGGLAASGRGGCAGRLGCP